MFLPQEQDWTPVILRKKKALTTTTTEVRQKVQNKSQGFNKLEVDTLTPSTEEAPKLKQLNILTSESRQELIKARLAAKMTQSDLAKKLNLQQRVINDLECGKVVNEQNILYNLNRILNVKLSFQKG